MTSLENNVRRVTRGSLGGQYGPDRGRKLVASLEIGDLLALRPLGTRRTVRLSLFDAYAYAMRLRASQTARRIKELRKAGHGRAEARRMAERE